MATILQISDPHLMSTPDGTLKGVPTAETLRMTLDRARLEVPEPDRVVLTGDLSHEETVAGYELLESLLGDWNDRCLLIPGNHDDRGGMRVVFDGLPGGDNDEVWFRETIGDWQLIGLDTHLSGQVQGELSDRMLERLSGWLAESSDRPSLVFMHHHATPVNSAWIDQLALRNPARLSAVLSGYRSVRGTFCGHIHQEFEGVFAGVPFFSAPATSTQFMPELDEMRFDPRPPGFRVIELEGDEMSTRVVRLDTLSFRPTGT